MSSTAVGNAKEATLQDILEALGGEGSVQIQVDGNPVSAAHPMPVAAPGGGALATAAKQDTGNTSLSTISTTLTTIDGKTPSKGTAAMAASSPVTTATDDTV